MTEKKEKKKSTILTIFDQMTPRARIKDEKKDEKEKKSETDTPPPPIDPEILRGKVAVAIYDYTAKDLTELSFSRGDIIINVVIPESETKNPGHDSGTEEFGIPSVSHWLKGELNGNLGLFPFNYVEVTFKRNVKVIAEYEFWPESEDEIPLKLGEEVVLISMSGDGWYRGKNEASGEVGLFPRNYVRFKDSNISAG